MDSYEATVSLYFEFLLWGELKLAGFQIGSSCGDWNLDAKELYPIYKVWLILPAHC